MEDGAAGELVEASASGNQLAHAVGRCSGAHGVVEVEAHRAGKRRDLVERDWNPPATIARRLLDVLPGVVVVLAPVVERLGLRARFVGPARLVARCNRVEGGGGGAAIEAEGAQRERAVPAGLRVVGLLLEGGGRVDEGVLGVAGGERDGGAIGQCVGGDGGVIEGGAGGGRVAGEELAATRARGSPVFSARARRSSGMRSAVAVAARGGSYGR